MIAYRGINGDNSIWGYQIGDLEEKHQWFKLDLDPSQARDSDLSSRFSDPPAHLPHHDPEKLTTDFLTALRKHTELVLRETLLESTLRSTPIEYIVCSQETWVDCVAPFN